MIVAAVCCDYFMIKNEIQTLCTIFCTSLYISLITTCHIQSIYKINFPYKIVKV